MLDSIWAHGYIIGAMNMKPYQYLLILLVMLPLAGCATTNGGISDLTALEEEETFKSSGLTPTANKLHFTDIAVPSGFKIIKDRSFVFQTEGIRVALLKYAGRAKAQDLLEFYKEQMTLYNWELLNVVQYERIILNFERGKQSCLITIESRGIKKVVTVSLAPKGSAAMEVEKSKSR